MPLHSIMVMRAVAYEHNELLHPPAEPAGACISFIRSSRHQTDSPAGKPAGGLSAEDSAVLYESTTAHGYQEDKQQQLYRAVERWLRPPLAKGEKELPVKVESFEELRCGLPTKNLTFRDIYDEWLKLLPRRSASSDPAALRAFLRERLALPRSLPDLKAEKTGDAEKGDWVAEFWIFEPEPGIRLPGVRISNKNTTAEITLVPGRDRTAVRRAIDAGRQVFAFDLRGTGEMHRRGGGTWSSLAGPPWTDLLGEWGGSVSNWAWFAGRPWPGQWALDLHQAARFCRQEFKARSVSVECENSYGWSALLAGAAFPELIQSGNVRIPLTSLRDDLRARGDHALADVPGLLERIDIHQLRGLWPDGHVSIGSEVGMRLNLTL